ncbi:MAG: Asp-tRNA(Asn)/Glu-tRNA(Gln) amidotransferase subunit GatA [Eubacterium sp.]|nr:Asp-tRNA(Asn)/Glu-tRNA(Gln) amidotransferase subunit GatA [Eubacterium sp.]
MNIDNILDFINTINNADTLGIDPLIQPVQSETAPLREDETCPKRNDGSAIVRLSPVLRDNMYVVPDSLSGNTANLPTDAQPGCAVDLTDPSIKSDDKYNAFITLLNDDDIGKTIAIKDNICVKGIRTTCASRILKDFIPPYSATVVERLEQVGISIIGKTNMDEFGMGNTTETSYFGPVKNPFDMDRTAGGSSGGSAAAVASGLADLALGSDTGGSIRQPAAHCGIYGLKPTYGAVSRYGLTAYASSMEQIGPMSKDVRSLAALMDVIYGYDPQDSTSVKLKTKDFLNSLTDDINGIRIGIPKGYIKQCDTGIADLIYEAASSLEKNGARISECDIQNTDCTVPAYYIIACAEASSNLSRFDGVRYGFRADGYTNLQDMYDKTREKGFGAEVRRRIELGNYVLRSGFYDDYYLKACRIRKIVCDTYKKLFESYDMILTPVTPTTAPLLGSITDPIQSYKNDLFTVPANLAGLPSLSIPIGMIDGLPVGVLLTGDHFSEQILINAAYAIER